MCEDSIQKAIEETIDYICLRLLGVAAVLCIIAYFMI